METKLEFPATVLSKPIDALQQSSDLCQVNYHTFSSCLSTYFVIAPFQVFLLSFCNMNNAVKL